MATASRTELLGSLMFIYRGLCGKEYPWPLQCGLRLNPQDTKVRFILGDSLADSRSGRQIKRAKSVGAKFYKMGFRSHRSHPFNLLPASGFPGMVKIGALRRHL